MRKGSIVLVPFPFTDLSGQKVRPALILHVSRGEDCIVAFISSAKEKKSPFMIPIRVTVGNGLRVDSIIRIDKIATLQKKIVMGELGVIDVRTQAGVDGALKKLLGL